MKGQKLFIRPIEAADAEAMGVFLDAHAAPHAGVPSCGLLGKLVGDIVAVLSIGIEAGAVRIDDLVVAKELRRKHIGRQMVGALDTLARKMERHWIIAHGDHEFLRRVGFTGNGVLRRRVGDGN